MADLFRYAAFISYSSKDASFARRLHRTLEGYSVPASLGQFDLIGGGKRNRIFPVFRDRDELSAGSLGERIESALRGSGALVVVCTPDAAASPWVQREVEYFVSLGRGDRVFAIIADSVPILDQSGADAMLSCMPPALRGKALVNDALEPLAADARMGKDGFRNAWLKIVGGLIGVNTGILRDRDRIRRRRNVAVVGAGTLSLLVALGMGVEFFDQAATLEALTARATVLTAEGKRDVALPFAIGGLGGARPEAEAAVEMLGGRFPLIAALPVPEGVTEIHFSDDEQIFGARTGNYELTLWNAENGAPLGSVFTASEFVFTPTRVIASHGDQADILDASTGRRVAHLENLRQPRDGDVLLAGGDTVVAGLSSSEIGVWDSHDGALRFALEVPNYEQPFTMSPGGDRLFVCDGTDACSLWDLHSGKALITGIPSAYDIAFSLDGKRVAARTGADTATLWNETGRVIGTFHMRGLISNVVLSPDGARLALATDWTGQLWDTATGAFLADLGAVAGDSVDGLRFTKDGSLLLTSGHGAEASLWDVRQSRVVIAFGREQAPFTFLSPDGERLIVQSFQDQPILLEARTGEKIVSLAVDAGDRVRAVHFSNRGGPFVLSTVNGADGVWSFDGRKIADLGGNNSENDVAISSDGRRAASLAGNGTVELWDVSTIVPREHGQELRAAICRAARNGEPDFRHDERDANNALAGFLRGRPWNVCDWRDLGELSGWAQMMRYWLVKVGVPWDYTVDSCVRLQPTFGCPAETVHH